MTFFFVVYFYINGMFLTDHDTKKQQKKPFKCPLGDNIFLCISVEFLVVPHTEIYCELRLINQCSCVSILFPNGENTDLTEYWEYMENGISRRSLKCENIDRYLS